MQTWTPLGHLRTIGAWPVLPRIRANTRLRGSNGGWHCSRDIAFESTSANTRTSKHSQRADTHKIEVRRNRANYLDDDLPLPPFLRASNHDNKVDALKSRHRDRSHAPHDIYVGSNQRTQAENMRHAPFSTAFAMNPYAHALATPVREDRFSQAKLPVSCLLDFHLVEADETDKEKSAGSRGARGRPALELTPLSLVAELVSRNKNKNPARLTTAESIAVEAWSAEVKSWAPQGSASYIMAKRTALDFVSQKPSGRLKKLVLSRRVLSAGGELNITWRDDMGGHVLQALRKVVSKKLSWLLRNKSNADKPGGVAAMPGLGGLEKLDSMDDVMCVLRLRPKGWVANDQIDKAGENVIEPEVGTTIVANSRVGDSSKLAETIAQPAQVYEPTWPAPTISPHDHSKEDGRNLVFPNTAQAHRQRRGMPDKEKPFLARICSAPPIPLASATYYPTIPYRKRRVPGYNLPHLLGTEALDKLLDQTVFKNCEFVALAGGNTTIISQIWLLKLASYVHEGKSEAIMI